MNEKNTILISLIAFPVTVLGIGKRIGVWTQGCSIGCYGCMSKHTWEFDKTKSKDIDDLVNELKNYQTKAITISGGEPFEQKNLLIFLQKLRAVGFEDVLLYSGYTQKYIFDNFLNHLEFIDALICEPFEHGNESTLLYKGSKNQKLIILNKKLENKYNGYATLTKNKKLQCFGNIIVGIPYQKDLEVINGM